MTPPPASAPPATQTNYNPGWEQSAAMALSSWEQQAALAISQGREPPPHPQVSMYSSTAPVPSQPGSGYLAALDPSTIVSPTY